MHESSIELHLEISCHLLSLPLGQGPDVYVEQNRCCYISWDTVAYQKYLLKSHWSRIKQKQLDSAQHATQARKTILILLEFSFLPAETCTRNSIGYVNCFLIVKVFSWECIPMFSRES